MTAPSKTLIETTRNCLATQRLLFALEECGAEYELVLRPDSYFVETYGLPGPLYIEDEFQLLEPNVILRYVARTRGSGALIAGDAREQAQIERWLEFSPWRFGAAVNRGDTGAVMKYLQLLDERLGGRDWLCGSFSVADCGLIPLALAADKLPLADFQRLRSYAERLAARPAWHRARARAFT
jgi:glutathione S-transferase